MLLGAQTTLLASAVLAIFFSDLQCIRQGSLAFTFQKHAPVEFFFKMRHSAPHRQMLLL